MRISDAENEVLPTYDIPPDLMNDVDNTRKVIAFGLGLHLQGEQNQTGNLVVHHAYTTWEARVTLKGAGFRQVSMRGVSVPWQSTTATTTFRPILCHLCGLGSSLARSVGVGLEGRTLGNNSELMT